MIFGSSLITSCFGHRFIGLGVSVRGKRKVSVGGECSIQNCPALLFLGSDNRMMRHLLNTSRTSTLLRGMGLKMRSNKVSNLEGHCRTNRHSSTFIYKCVGMLSTTGHRRRTKGMTTSFLRKGRRGVLRCRNCFSVFCHCVRSVGSSTFLCIMGRGGRVTSEFPRRTSSLGHEVLRS